eukprot:scaffold37624_cov62-Phaeocystis_antarctica.AAC.2
MPHGAMTTDCVICVHSVVCRWHARECHVVGGASGAMRCMRMRAVRANFAWNHHPCSPEK